MKMTRLRDFGRKYVFLLPIVTLVTVSTVLVSALFTAPTLAPFVFQTFFKPLLYENSIYGTRMQYLGWIWQPENHFNGTDTRFVVFKPVNLDPSYVAYFFLGASSIRHLKVPEGVNGPSPSLSNTSSARLGNTTWHIVSNTSSTLAGRPAYDLAYWGSNDSGIFNVKEVTTVIGDKKYFVEYIAADYIYHQYAATVHNMITSLEIVNPTKVSYR
jgi:hypothetical protein